MQSLKRILWLGTLLCLAAACLDGPADVVSQDAEAARGASGSPGPTDPADAAGTVRSDAAGTVAPDQLEQRPPPSMPPPSEAERGTTPAPRTGPSYYVDSLSGDDANAGTSPSAPWRSLGRVGAALTAGTTVNLKRGSAWDTGFTIAGSGTAEQPIVVQAYGDGPRPVVSNPGGGRFGDALTIAGSHVVVRDLLVRDAGEAGVSVLEGADRNTIIDVEATAVGLGFLLEGRHNLVTRSYAHDLRMVVNTPGGDDDYGAVGYWVGNHDNEISYSRCVNCIAPSEDYGTDGGFAEVFREGDNTVIHHNWAENVNGFLEIGSRDGTTISDVRVTYNVVRESLGFVCLHTEGTFRGRLERLLVDNNTVVDSSGRAAFFCARDLRALVVRNNIFDVTGPIARNGDFARSNNLYGLPAGVSPGFPLGPGERIAEPQFVDPAAGNVRLLPTSPAVDAGVFLGPAMDLDGVDVPRGRAPDIGAYELAPS